MNKLSNDFNQEIFTYKVPSGLTVYHVHRPGFQKSAAVYATGFGALDLVQQTSEGLITHKAGVAHFLEHKLFEEESGVDILSQFSNMGANGNAFTSYDATMYTFSHTGPIEGPLRTLLQFVSHLNITEASVEKEKGIIIEELRMYEQMADISFFMELNRNIYHTFPYIHDIGGTEASVSATTVEDLRKAYELNYEDHHMVLVIVSGETPEHVQAIVLSERPEREDTVETTTLFEAEPLQVVVPYREVTGDVSREKIGIAYKFEYTGTDIIFDEFLLKVLLESWFTDVNPAYQSWRDEGIISRAFTTDVALKEGIGVLYFIDEGINLEAFVQFVDTVLKNSTVDDALIEQLKRRYYGEMVFGLSQMEQTAVNIAQYHLDDSNYFDMLKRIKNFNGQDVSIAESNLNNLDKTILVMK